MNDKSAAHRAAIPKSELPFDPDGLLAAQRNDLGIETRTRVTSTDEDTSQLTHHTPTPTSARVGAVPRKLEECIQPGVPRKFLDSAMPEESKERLHAWNSKSSSVNC